MRVRLLPHSAAHLRALRAGGQAYRELTRLSVAEGLSAMVAGPETSPEFIARQEAVEFDPWIHGFGIVDDDANEVVGLGGYKGPPDEDGAVEIAYGVAPPREGRGYASAAARALVERAFTCEPVRRILAHTLCERNASTRILGQTGFRHVGEVIDPEDGPVWRWERSR